MKAKHNKKRNTVFLYEALVRELTKAITTQNPSRSATVKNILQEHFRSGKTLFSELGCFSALSDTRGLDSYTAEKMVFRAKKAYDELSPEDIFSEQSQVIKKINTQLGKEVYDNFVPNYKTYATIAQIFGTKAPIKSRVLMEKKIIDVMTTSESSGTGTMKPVDSLVVGQFVKNFNKAYSHLLPEQINLLNKYVLSFGPNVADFQVTMGTELKRIYEEVQQSLESEEVQSDAEMRENTQKILSQLDEWDIRDIDDKKLTKVLKLQELVREYHADAN
jgi:flagellin-specific chaperone FliS